MERGSDLLLLFWGKGDEEQRGKCFAQDSLQANHEARGSSGSLDPTVLVVQLLPPRMRLAQAAARSRPPANWVLSSAL